MFKNIRKRLFRLSVQNLFIKPQALFALHKKGLLAPAYSNGDTFNGIYRWSRDSKLPMEYAHATLHIVNKAYADNYNKYEAAALIICRLIIVDDEDNLIYENNDEYSRLHGLFRRPLKNIENNLKELINEGDIRSSIEEKIITSFELVYKKYPEFKKKNPPIPIQISWWKLAYNDSKTDRHKIQGCFETVEDVIDFISDKEHTDELFWDYPTNLHTDYERWKYSGNTEESSLKNPEWVPTSPPNNNFEKKSIFAMPKRSWNVFWNKYQGALTGSNIDHWEALQESAFIRPGEEKYSLYKILDKPYQQEIFK